MFVPNDLKWSIAQSMLSSYVTPRTRVYGPLGVLRRYLQVVGLTMDDCGFVLWGTARKVHLFHDCLVDLQALMSEAWDFTLTMRLRTRSGAELLPEIDAQETSFVLEKTPEYSACQASVLHLTGGWPTRA
ncbi:unnamed protein product [Effrenium voratum]|uniref:Uncharacterized protein n=1 Tax=Effrenium voratum TaxID=2562239 RepID=A0AA36N2X7_9DINO|nr:unnamed protein product [Effrenium voratum]